MNTHPKVTTETKPNECVDLMTIREDFACRLFAAKYTKHHDAEERALMACACVRDADLLIWALNQVPDVVPPMHQEGRDKELAKIKALDEWAAKGFIEDTEPTPA